METIKAFFNYQLFEVGEWSLKLSNIIFLVLTVLLVRMAIKLFRVFVNKTVKKRDWIDEEKTKAIYRIGRFTILILGFILAIWSLDFGSVFKNFLEQEIISGEHPIIVRNVFIAIFVFLVATMLVRLSIVLLKVSLRNHGTVDRGREFTIVRLYKYFAYFLIIIFTLHLAGVNLYGLFVGSAVLLVGIGLAIQHLLSDFFSGFILLFEDSFDVGDVIHMEDDVVMVKRIDLRTSTVMQRDGNLLTIPNRLLTDNRITNWTQESHYSRMSIQVGVAYGSDLQMVKNLLYQAALSHPQVNKDKPIKILFENFGDNGLEFDLLFWIRNSWEYKELLSDIRFAIDLKFRENNIEIPFPQRDVHFRSPLKKEV